MRLKSCWGDSEIKSFNILEAVADDRPGRRFATPNSLFLLSKTGPSSRAVDLLILMFQLGLTGQDWKVRFEVRLPKLSWRRTACWSRAFLTRGLVNVDLAQAKQMLRESERTDPSLGFEKHPRKSIPLNEKV